MSISPNMNLVIPDVGVTPGPQYATDIDASLTIIDNHNHVPGAGVAIPSAGLDINADLPFNGNNAISLRSMRMTPQLSPLALTSDLGCVYVSGVDLYYNDSLGNQIQITASGGVAGTPGSIANLTSPASATYVAIDQTFVWQSDAATAANMDGGSVLLRNIVANSKALTLNPPSAMAADFSLTLPSLPAASSFVTMTNTGIMAGSINTSAGITGSNIAVNTITGGGSGNLALATVTQANMGPVNINTSANSGSFTTSSTTYVDVITTASITTFGHPVMIMLQPDTQAAGGSGYISMFSSGANATVQFAIIRIDGGTTTVYENQIQWADTATTAIPNITDAPGKICYIDTGVAAVAVQYKLQVKVQAGTTAGIINCVLLAYEI